MLFAPLQFIQLNHEGFEVVVDPYLSGSRYANVEECESLGLPFCGELIVRILNGVRSEEHEIFQCVFVTRCSSCPALLDGAG